MKYTFGIVSWLPDKPEDRELRIKNIEILIGSLDKMFHNPNVMIIAQNWQDYKVPSNNPNIRVFCYDKLGILKARFTLRDRFLESEFDYLVMCDDDCRPYGDPTSFIKGMESHPDGFAYREDTAGKALPSQLNLFAISKSLYTKEPMVNIDPQKSEGFEDDIFTTLLTYKYPDLRWHFTNFGSNHFKNPNLTSQPPSTWASDPNNKWQKLYANTKAYIERIKNGDYSFEKKSIDQPIDLVIPFVDNTDPIWQQSLLNYCKTHTYVKKPNMNGERFRNLHLFEYQIALVYKFMPWIRNIFLIVSNPEQVPKNIDMSKIKVVLHSDIIPRKHLPTFNSTTIEMFIYNIEGLSEYFIYGNDDMFPIKPLKPSDFYNEISMFPNIKFNKVIPTTHLNQFNLVCDRQYRQVGAALQKRVNTVEYYRPEHIYTPLRLSSCKKIFSKLESCIVPSIDAFRTQFQHNQYIYALYEFFNKTYYDAVTSFVYVDTTKSGEEIANIILSGKYDTICINDKKTNNNLDGWSTQIAQAFETLLSKDLSEFE